jgi:outer membrane beta-barrel protein
MESRFQRIVLAMLLAASATSLQAAEEGRNVLDDVVSPDLQRRHIDEDKIDSENIEVGFYTGVLSVEDFGSNDVYGARLAYVVTEDIFVEANLAFSTLQKTTWETLTPGQLLTDKERELMYYNLALGWNLFPGETYIGRYAFYSNLYLIAGAGNTEFASDQFFTYHFGGGFRFFVTDWAAFHMDVRNYVMSHTIFGEKKDIQNLETSIGLTVFF